ncbi:hypothetical protein [Aquimarina pacifica]|uniref:hypothetical protein n=1 Tax=Aquimarina pacifica TaxID=1296415 RepID=UPI000471D2E3|nr:hypothetical protein [Aquimarina pacifica]
MQQTLTKKKIKYPILIIKLLMLNLFVFVSIRGYQETIFELGLNHRNQYTISDFIELTTKRTYFRPSLLLLLPLIGVFIQNKIGWILTCSYFYFILTTSAYSTIFDGLKSYEEILFFATVLVVALLLAWIMNRKKIVQQVYRINPDDILITNTKAFSLGIFFTLVLAWVQMI